MSASLEIAGLRSDGTEFPVDVSLNPIQVGSRLEVMATVRDVSDRERRQRQLERQNDRLEEFVDVVSHDLRNPLQVASGKVALTRERDDDALLDDVERAHERMDALVDDLLTLARQGEFVGEPTTVDVEPTARRAWSNVDTCECTVDVEDDIGSVLADQSRLLELFENLYRNAVEHAGPDVTVTIGALRDGFYVADDGPGIPDERRDAVFDRGYTSDTEGTGLGLAIVHRIVEAHGWTVGVTESTGGGARFEVTTTRTSDTLLPE
jgi:signal transduction histidine kinase